MCQIKHVIPGQNGGATTLASVPLQSPITLDYSASSVPSSTCPHRHGSNSRMNENEAVTFKPDPTSHHHYHHLLHMRLRGLGNSRHNAKLHNNCVICAEAFAVKDVVCQLPCGHIHHSECILKWLDTSQKDTCPTCRQSISVTPSTAVAGIGQTNNVDDKDGYFDDESRRRRHHHNFDLIMRRVLRAREEQRLIYEETSKKRFPPCSHDNNFECYVDDIQDQDVIIHDSVHKHASSNHTNWSSRSKISVCSSDWLVDDLEEFLNVAVNQDEDNNNGYELFC
jgi:hypothetical protein